MPYGQVNVDKVVNSDGTVTGGLYGFKNRIINGAMVIDQRNAGALVAGAVGNTYGVDRTLIGVFGSGTGRISAQQSSTAPTGFTNSLVGTVTTADASPSTYYGYAISHRIEGYNTADFGFGATGASSITLSFWVRSSITGTYCLTFCNENVDRAYATTYTINSANTWEYKTITVAGDTTGTWYKTTNAGVILVWGLGGGSGRQAPSLNTWNTGAAGGYTITDASGCVDWIATNGATFYITGVQLEKGSTATSFDFRAYGTELALCQRYYYKNQASGGADYFGSGQAYSATSAIICTPFAVPMRTNPTALEQNGQPAHYRLLNSSGSGVNGSSVPVFNTSSAFMASTVFTVASGLTAGNGTLAFSGNAAAYLAWSAEL